MLVSMKDMLAEASRRGYAVGAFNFASLESGRAVIMAAERAHAPVILQHAPPHEEFVPLDMAAPIMLDLAKRATVPVCVHLDHGGPEDLCYRALRMGMTSVMFDGSALPYAENLAATARVVRAAHAVGATVEAELGSMPNNLKGDMGEYRPEDFYTKPEEAAEFVARTGVDALAISFGTVHGVYRAKPALALDVVDSVRCATGNLPLVMHGGSGLSTDDYRQAITHGIRKINYYTYSALAGGKGVVDYLGRKPKRVFYHDIVQAGTRAIEADIEKVIRLFNNGTNR